MSREAILGNQDESSTGGLVFAFGGGLLILFLVMVALYGSNATLSFRIIFPLVTIFFTSVSLIYSLTVGSRNIFEPVVPASFMLGILFGVRPIAMTMVGDVDYYLWVPISEHLSEAFFLGMLGVLLFLFGYYIKADRSLRPSGVYGAQNERLDFSSRRLYSYIGFIVIVSFVLFAIYLFAGGSPWEMLKMMAAGRSEALVNMIVIRSEYLSVAPILSACAAILIITFSRKQELSRKKKIIIIALVLYPVIVFMLMGVRRFILPSVLIPIAVYYLAKRKRPSLRMVAIIAPVVIVLVAAIPYMRTEGARTQAGGLSNFIEFAFKEHKVLLANIFLKHDTEMVSILSVEVGSLREMEDFYYGRATIGDLVFAPIPSSLFPWKPTTARDQLLVETFGSKCNATAGGLCPDFSIVGTFYQDFWYFGVIGGMFFLGVSSRWLWVKYRRNPSSAMNIVGVSCWTVFLPIIIRAGFMPSFAWFLYFLLPCVFGVFLSRRIVLRTAINVSA